MHLPKGGAPSQIVINQCVLQHVVTHVESVVRAAREEGLQASFTPNVQPLKANRRRRLPV
jgi:hypothetical protein